MINLVAFFKQIRSINLLMLVLVQFITNYAFDYDISFFYLLLLNLSTVLIAAAGYLINDIYDYEIDIINKPNLVQVRPSINSFYLLSGAGLIVGLFLSYLSNLFLFFLFVLAFVNLFLYAKYVSRYKLFGNVLISLLIVESILIVPFLYFCIFSNVIEETFTAVLFYASFAFFLNWAREIIKDIEDIEGDKVFDRKSLPILVGEFYSKVFVVCLATVTVFLLSKFTFLSSNLVIVPISFGLLVTIILTMIAEHKKDFKRISLLLKLIMLFGLLSPLFL